MLTMLNKTVILLVVMSVLGLSGCCKDETVTQMDSPNKAFLAVLFVRDCGATDVEHTLITLKSNSSWLGTKETIFVTKYDHQPKMRWKSDSELVVYCPGCKPEEVRLQKTKFRSVTIDYKFGVAGLGY